MCLSEAQKNDVGNFERSVRHPFLSTKKLQTALLRTGTFYKESIKMLFKFTQSGDVVADALRKSMET